MTTTHPTPVSASGAVSSQSEAVSILNPTRYEFSYRNDFNDKYEADRDTDPDGEYVLLADVQPAIDAWNSRTERAAIQPAGEAVDAERYRMLRRKVCIVGGKFHILNLDPIYLASHAEIELDAAIDAQILTTKGKE